MGETATLSFEQQCNSLSTASQRVYSPVTGVISRITIAWPSGCNFLVEVLFRIGTIQVVPTPATGADEGIRLNNWTEQVAPNYPVQMNDQIEMYLINHDTVNNHKIAALVHIDVIEAGSEPIIRKPSACVIQPSDSLGSV